MSSLRIAALALLAATVSTAFEVQAQSRQQQRDKAAAKQNAPPPRQEKQFPLGGSWTAVSISGKPPGANRPTLQVDDNLRGTGFAGCNIFSATAYPLREQAFAVGPIALTKKACDAGQMASERAFLVALRAAQKWDLVDGRLVITGGGGELRFERGL
ncbi:MAG: META domain-containing protein [Bosea sp. (in: a-proteobacteria)]